MLFDIHTHILPETDDGAKSQEEALKLLEALRDNGVGAVAATPHFYIEFANIDEYTAMAQQKLLDLKIAAGENAPEIIEGYEIRYFKGISRTPDIKRLTLGGSDYILIEFAYNQAITEIIVDDIADIYYNFGITPILAHLERYSKYHGYKYALELVEDGVALAHINASSLFSEHKKVSLSLIKDKIATLMASDTHSLLSRPPLQKEAFNIISNNLGEKAVEDLISNSERLYYEITAKNKIVG